jgi:multiple antibiotic resistance protein
MTEVSLSKLLLTLLVGMGPLKGMLVYMSMTEDADLDTRRKMAFAAVGTAAGGAVGLLVLGSALQSLLHFSLGALSICGGIILLILSIQIVLGEGASPEGHEQKELMEQAVSPLGTPLMLNPVGMVALVTFSAETQSLSGYLVIVLGIAIMATVDLIALLVSGRLAHHLSHAVIAVMEKLFSILVAALAVQLIVDGLTALGLVSAVSH